MLLLQLTATVISVLSEDHAIFQVTLLSSVLSSNELNAPAILNINRFQVLQPQRYIAWTVVQRCCPKCPISLGTFCVGLTCIQRFTCLRACDTLWENSNKLLIERSSFMPLTVQQFANSWYTYPVVLFMWQNNCKTNFYYTKKIWCIRLNLF